MTPSAKLGLAKHQKQTSGADAIKNLFLA